MIDRNGKEWQLWKDAYKVREELTPPPPHNEDNKTYWERVVDRTNDTYNAYKESSIGTLAQYIFMGIREQLLAESKEQERIHGLIEGVKERLTAEPWQD